MSDTRLQAWAVAISEEGRLAGFPRSIHTRDQLAKLVYKTFSSLSFLHFFRTLTLVIFGDILTEIFAKNIFRTLTMVIFGGSVLHHALNAPHYVYSYAPHRPTSLSRWR